MAYGACCQAGLRQRGALERSEVLRAVLAGGCRARAGTGVRNRAGRDAISDMKGVAAEALEVDRWEVDRWEADRWEPGRSAPPAFSAEPARHA